jgi:phospholipid/cholesterol/gamma-HCH transport system substrate-binding protein
MNPAHGHMTGARRARRESRRHLRAAIIALLLIGVAFYIAFTKQVPFTSHFTVRGAFQSANQLKAGNPVRIAGLPIGSVTGIAPGPDNTSIVTMELDQHTGVHADASLAIEPRLLFEGNFYVALDPGTPDAPPLRSGTTIPLAHTTTPVQIDQVLDVLDSPTRYSLKQTVAALATGLGTSAAQGTGASNLRAAADQLQAALPSVTQVATAAQGTEPGDLTRAIDSSSDVAAELARDPAALADIVTSSDRVFGALSADDAALAQSVAGLDRFVRLAPPALSALDGALPQLTSFATALRPSLTTAPGTLSASSDLFAQLQRLTAPGELPALVTALAPVLRDAPVLEQRLEPLLPLLSALNECTSHNIVPTLDQELQDGANTTGYSAWKDLLHLGAALSGASASFDGNGSALRIGVAEGSASAAVIPGFGQLTESYQGEGVRPEWLGYGVVPPFRPDEQCSLQPVPNVNSQ